MKNLSMLSLVALMIIFSGVVSAQEATNDPTTIEVIEQVGETIESLSSNLYTGAKSAISDLAKALEVPATHVYKILIRQQIVNSIFLLCLSTFFLITCITSTIIGLEKYTDWLYFNNREITPFILIPIICGLACISIILFKGENIITGLLNPEYGAMKEIVNWIK